MAKTRVELILDAENRTDKAFDKANKNIGKLEKNAQRVKALGNVFAAVTGGAVAGALAMDALSDSLIETLDLLDDIGKASRRLGLTTDELQELRIVAKASGVEISAFDTAFQRFARRAGQARLGTGELVKTFDLLDISLKDNEGNLKTNAELFKEFGEGINSVSDKNVQLALTMSGVDTEGVKLIDMFRTSSEEQQKVIDKSRELGGVYSESLIKKAELYRTQIGLVKDAQEILNQESNIGMAQIVLDWENMKLKIIETKNELLSYIGWMGISHDETAKNLIETNRLFDQQIKRLKQKLALETDPERIKVFQKNLDYAEKEKKVVEDQIKERIQSFEKISELEAKRGKEVKQITSEQLDEKLATKDTIKEKEKLVKVTEEYTKATEQANKSGPSSSSFGTAKKETEELTEETEKATKAKKEWFSVTGQPGKDTSGQTVTPSELTRENGQAKAQEFITAAQEVFNQNPIVPRVRMPTAKSIVNDPVTASSSINEGGFSTISISRDSLKEGSKA